ncbi:hypothetical protein IQ07DRAFT_622405 [Pyrenochaeta sp. DS3sAY3a]|nr:hypothetical protein IQ07DRAFT_622405 [Pyrenochaeta sp. DS3sAY3a]
MPPARIDIEARQKPLYGYPSLSNFIASDFDRTSLIYNRFDELSARNLLYLQSELAELQAQQRAFDKEDLKAEKDLGRQQCARNFASFEQAALSTQNSDATQKARWDLMIKIRATLKEYREALQSEVSMIAHPPPSKSVYRAFKNEVFVKSENGLIPVLGGNSAGLYDDVDELMALRVQENPDRLSTFVQENLGFLFPDRKRSRNGIAYASDRAIMSFIAWFSTFLAALLLIGAIVILYKVRSPEWRLGLIATFTTLFAGSVGLLTNARRAELFAATAA